MRANESARRIFVEAMRLTEHASPAVALNVVDSVLHLMLHNDGELSAFEARLQALLEENPQLVSEAIREGGAEFQAKKARTRFALQNRNLAKPVGAGSFRLLCARAWRKVSGR